MTPWTIHEGDALTVLRTLPDASVQTCVTSPPYWGLRDYGTATWEGGEATCQHLAPMPGGFKSSTLPAYGNGLTPEVLEDQVVRRRQQYRDVCATCGARRVDSQLGLEPTPELYVERLVELFREVRRVLRDDGTLWLNLGDSYCAAPRGSASPETSTLTNPHRHLEVTGAPIDKSGPRIGHRACATCGAPYARQVVREGSKLYRTGKSAEKVGVGLRTAFSGYEDGSSAPVFVTVGWRRPCDHEGDSVAGVVLDPFSGAGTTGLVANRLGRAFVGIELNPEYAAMARRRITDDAPLVHAIAPASRDPEQLSLVGEVSA